MRIFEFFSKLWWCFFIWHERYPTWEEMCEEVEAVRARHGLHSVVLCTHDIGMSSGGDPGVGNRLMAEVFKQFVLHFPDIPALPQHAVGLAALELGLSPVRIIWPPGPDTPLVRSHASYNTDTVVAEQRRLLKDDRMFPPTLTLLITSPDHAGRTRRVYVKRGFGRVMLVPVPLGQQKYLDRNCLYFSMRWGARIPRVGWLLYRGRELLARLKFLAEGKM